jgi:hypothetical protein
VVEVAQAVVRYVGIADVRILEAKQVKRDKGVDLPEDLIWSRKNGFKLTLDLTPELEALLKEQGHFRISAVTDSGGENVVSTADNPSHEGDTVVVKEDGRVTSKEERKGKDK